MHWCSACYNKKEAKYLNTLALHYPMDLLTAHGEYNVELQEIYKLYIVCITSSMLEKVTRISNTYFTGFGNALVEC